MRSGRTITLELGPLCLAVMLGLLACGCLTPELWDERAERKPAPDPRVELRLKASSPADVLLLYDELERASGKVRRRALFLFANAPQLMQGKKPVFADPGIGESFDPIPILAERPDETSVPPPELYAISPLPMTFSLESHGRELLEFSLPEHGQWLTTRKFLFLPVVVVADATGFGAVVGSAVAMEAMGGGQTFSVPVP